MTFVPFENHIPVHTSAYKIKEKPVYLHTPVHNGPVFSKVIYQNILLKNWQA